MEYKVSQGNCEICQTENIKCLFTSCCKYNNGLCYKCWNKISNIDEDNQVEFNCPYCRYIEVFHYLRTPDEVKFLFELDEQIENLINFEDVKRSYLCGEELEVFCAYLMEQTEVNKMNEPKPKEKKIRILTADGKMKIINENKLHKYQDEDELNEIDDFDEYDAPPLNTKQSHKVKVNDVFEFGANYSNAHTPDKSLFFNKNELSFYSYRMKIGEYKRGKLYVYYKNWSNTISNPISNHIMKMVKYHKNIHCPIKPINL